MNFGITISNLNMEIMQDYVAWIEIVLLYTFKLNIFIKILLMMLTNGLMHLAMIKIIIDL